MGYSIGASTELAESVDLLDPRGGADRAKGELARAVDFAEALAGAAGRDAQLARELASEAIATGRAHDNLLALWRDHGVEAEFLTAVRQHGREALLSDLHQTEVRADREGTLTWDWPALGAAVNERINGFRAAGDGPSRLNRGGIELHLGSGTQVTKGSLLITAYLAETETSFSKCVSNTFTIAPR
jgi:thymidine phosphorylase